MDIFKSEQARVEKRIDEVVPQLEDVGARGRMIAAELHKIRNALKHPASSGGNVFGSDLSTEQVQKKFGDIKLELDVYSEKSGTLIADLTKIITEIRYPFPRALI
jgi:hypothetical protein